jgi:DNA-directed RNA polymerase specialized sigma24 family protein
VREPKSRADIRLPIQQWELDLIRGVVEESGERVADELEAELAQTLANLKIRIPPGIRNWKAYLREALRNKASNWFRNRRRRLRREVPILAMGNEALQGVWISEESLPTRDAHDLRIALAHFWEKLDPDLRDLWTLLADKNGNQAAVSRLLGLHRNTVRRRICQIRAALGRHGFSAPV